MGEQTSMTYKAPVEAFPAGDFLREELEARGWTQDDLAEIIGCNVKTINEIVNGKRGITTDTAIGLGAAFDTSPDLWMRLDQSYQLWLSRGKNTDIVTQKARLYEFAPIKEMARRGWIQISENVDVVEASVAQFFGLRNLNERPALPCATRRSTSYYEELSPAQMAWVHRAKNLAQGVQVGKFTKEAAKSAVSKLQLLLHEPAEARHVSRVLAEAGIRLVIVAPLTGMKIDGACIWVDNLPIIALSLRYDRIDNFWFTLLHEICHVIDGELSIDSDLDKTASDETLPDYEIAANKFAAKSLVNQKSIESFINRHRPLYYQKEIEKFAKVKNVHPGIIVGQLHAHKALQYSNLRKLLVPVREIVASSTLTDGWGHIAP